MTVQAFTAALLFHTGLAILPGHSDFAVEVDSRGSWHKRGGDSLMQDPEEELMEATKEAVADLFDEANGTEENEQKEKSVGGGSEAMATAESERVRLAKLRKMQAGRDGWVGWNEVEGTTSAPTTQTTSKALLWSDEYEACLQHETEWRSATLRQNRTHEADHRSCRARCASVEGCAHWSYHVVGGTCLLQNSSAVKAESKGVVSGIPGCRDKDPHLHFGLNAGGQGCYHLSAAFTPLDMSGQSRSTESSYDTCQVRCLATKGCVSFTYFLRDRGCHLQADGSQLVYLTGTIAGGAACNASDKANFDGYIKHLPRLDRRNGAIPCEDSWAAFFPSDLPDLDEPGDLAKDQEVKCEALYSHRLGLCKNSAEVRERCPKMCGHCGQDTLAVPPACADGREDEPPVFYESNETLSCTAVKYACQHDEEVDSKCQLTCGRCNTTTTTTDTPEMDLEEAREATSGSRRRSMGYCFTRRRRLF